jgi:hypothetical protein
MSIKQGMIALHECHKSKEQVKVSYHRKFWMFIFKKISTGDKKYTRVCVSYSK